MPTIADHRLHSQQLTQTTFETPAEVVAWLGAVQAQDYPGAKWSLAMRLNGYKDTDLDQSFADGSILRTHVMRPTWHFVTPDDIRWILELTAPRVHALNAYYYRKSGLDADVFRRSNAVMIQALQGGQYRTRTEIASALAEIGIDADGLRLGLLMMQAELDGLICSGPRRGNQFTYALLDARAPYARRLPRDEALAELTRRYFAGHGPATVKDFVWWSGLTVADAKKGIEMVAPDLTPEVIDGQTYWFSASTSPAGPSMTAWLLSTYDEFLIGFEAFDRARMGPEDVREKLVFDFTFVIGNRIAGSWRRTFSKGAVIIELAPFNPLSPAETDALNAAIKRFSEFLDMPTVLA